MPPEDFGHHKDQKFLFIMNSNIKQLIIKLSSAFKKIGNVSDNVSTQYNPMHENKVKICWRKKEVEMKIKRIEEGVEVLKEDLGSGLLATDFWASADGQSLAGFNPQPKATALFNKITVDLSKSLKAAGFPNLGDYYLIKLDDGKFVIVLPMGKYQWGMLIDGEKVALGLLINIVLPKIIESFEAAMKD